MKLQEEEEEEEGKAGCFLLLPPLTGQRSTCTYLPDLAYILENVRLSIPATKAERGRNSQLVNYMVTHRHHLFSMHTSYPRTKSLIIPNIKLSPHLSTKARAKPSKQKTVDPPPRNIRKTGPNHATGRTTSHPIPPFHHQPLSSPLQQKKRPLLFSETGKGKTLACLQGWKKTAASLALSRCVCRNGLPYLTLRCLALPYQVGTCLCVRYHVV